LPLRLRPAASISPSDGIDVPCTNAALAYVYPWFSRFDAARAARAGSIVRSPAFRDG
jgi:hypothetical protein